VLSYFVHDHQKSTEWYTVAVTTTVSWPWQYQYTVWHWPWRSLSWEEEDTECHGDAAYGNVWALALTWHKWRQKRVNSKQYQYSKPRPTGYAVLETMNALHVDTRHCSKLSSGAHQHYCNALCTRRYRNFLIGIFYFDSPCSSPSVCLYTCH